jgi:hypothetical protein
LSNDLDFAERIRLGMPVPGSEILNRRTRGLSAIRRDFLSRLAAVLGIRAESSMIVRWRRLGEHANSRTVVDASFELVLHGGAKAISALFSDRWILCYPDDPESKQAVEAEMDRMCEKALKAATA